MPDRTMKCSDCGAEFIWSEREQGFFQSKGLTHEPKRCVPCRAAKRAKYANRPDGKRDSRR